MDETLKNALQYAGFLGDRLREANAQATPVESLIIIPLITDAVEVAMKIRALIAARAA